MANKPNQSIVRLADTVTIAKQLAAALARALDQLSTTCEGNLPILFAGWAALAKAEGRPIQDFWELRGLEEAPSLLDAIGINEWDWACSFDLPTGYAIRVAVTQSNRDADLWWTIALESPEGEHGSVSFTVGTVGGEDLERIVRIVKTALDYEGYLVFDGTEAEWQTYLQSVEQNSAKPNPFSDIELNEQQRAIVGALTNGNCYLQLEPDATYQLYHEDQAIGYSLSEADVDGLLSNGLVYKNN